MARIIFTACMMLLAVAVAAPAGRAAWQLGENGPVIHGFGEAAFGLKLGHDQTTHDEFNMAEQRLQLKTKTFPEWTPWMADWGTAFEAKGDLLIDEYDSSADAELRALSLGVSPASWFDLKAGRQVFTWGTGDYLFVNDLFPKDYESFFIGRDDEYLKKPNDGAKMSVFHQAANLDVIIIPEFEPSTVPDGERVSFYDSFQGGITGTASDRTLVEPDQNLDNTQAALRLYRTLENYEVAGYFFRGNYSQPRGYLNEFNRELFYPRLDAYGTSARGPGFGGIVNAEGAYYHSRQDSNGDNRLIENSSLRLLVGYDKDLGNDWRLGLQYQYDQILEYDAYLKALLPADTVWDQRRHLNTLRLTKLFKNQTVRAGLFVFFSPSDLDGYVRPTIDYDLSDAWKLSAGANLFWGEDTYTEFGQFEHNKNIYVRLRYGF